MRNCGCLKAGGCGVRLDWGFVRWGIDPGEDTQLFEEWEVRHGRLKINICLPGEGILERGLMTWGLLLGGCRLCIGKEDGGVVI